MTDIANLGIKIDASDADAAAAKLDRLNEAGTRLGASQDSWQASQRRLVDSMREVGSTATVSEVGLTASRKAMMDVSTAADIMATRQAAAFRTISEEAHVSSRAVNETLVLARELGRQNFSRMAGSATILAQSLRSTNSSMGDVFRSLGLMLGLIERVPPAMEAATASEMALNEATVLVMESEAGAAAAALASAEARVAAAEKVFAGNEAVARSEAQQLKAAVALIAANEELAGAATAAALAEERLAIAESQAAIAAGRATASTEALGATTAEALGATTAEAGASGTVAMTTLGAAVTGVGIAVAVVGAGFISAFESMKASTGDLTDSMGLTQKQMQRLKDDGVSTTITLGDAWKGLGRTIKDYMGGAWDKVGEGAFLVAKGIGVVLTAIAATVVGTIRGMVNVVGSLIQDTLNIAIAGINLLIDGANKALGTKFSELRSLGGFDANPLKAFGNGFMEGATGTVNAAKGFYGRWKGHSADAGRERINDVDGDPGKGGRSGGATNDQADALDKLIDKLRQQNAEQEFQDSLIGKSIKDREIALAQHKFENELKASGIDLDKQSIATKATIKALEDDAVRLATAKAKREQEAEDLKRAQQAAKDYANSLREVNDAIREAASAFGDVFGQAGRGFATLIEQTIRYGETQKNILQQIADAKIKYGADSATVANLEKAQAQNQIGHYGDMLGAAKSFFSQTSTGYKVLQTAEQVWRAYQLASAIASIAMKGVETSAAVAADTATTASSVAASTTKAGASVIAGAAKMFEELGPFGFVAVGAMMALMAGLGFGGGGGATAAANPLDTSNFTSDAYTSPYSTQPGKNGLYNPANAPTTPNYGAQGGFTVAPTYNITAPGADAGTVQQIQDLLAAHTATTVNLARQAAASDAASLAMRQRIGGR